MGQIAGALLIVDEGGGGGGITSWGQTSTAHATHAGDPNGVVTGAVGDLLLDTTTPAVWQNTDGAMAWQLVGPTVATGDVVVRQFPFAFDTPNLLTGADLYNPTIGDLLLAGWIEIVTPWDGTTPKGDFGSFIVNDRVVQAESIGAGLCDVVGSGVMSMDQPPTTPAGAGLVIPQVQQGGAILAGGGKVPGRFTTNNAIRAMVSQSGFGPANATATADNTPPVLPLVVVAGVNDEFVYVPTGDTYTVAPGSYATVADCAVAMMTATTGGNPLSDVVNVTSDGTFIILWALAAGTTLNGQVAIGVGTNDVSAGLGWDGTEQFANGTDDGGDPGSTQGSATLYLVTATPA